MDLDRLLDDLVAESDALDALVAERLDAWDRPTPAPGWTVAHQIAHLAWTDRAAVLAATDPADFGALLDRAMHDPDGFVDAEAEAWAAPALADQGGVDALIETWRAGRGELIDALGQVAPGGRLPWFGPPMGAASMATARLMETWAHGQDVVDALGAERRPTERLRHIADLGVRTRGFSYAVRGLEPPTEDVRVELTGPRGELWNWGEEAAPQWVMGTALDFCLVVTQRRHVDDTELAVMGEQANEWMVIAQCFAGGPTLGPAATAGGPGGMPA